MDYRALSELVLMGLLGLSTLLLALGFSVRVFLAPILREIFDRLGRGRSFDTGVSARIELLESRILELEQSLERVETVERFERQLAAPAASDE